MELSSYFSDFVSKINPTPSQKKIMMREHKRLRELLSEDATLRAVLLTTFIQGSQRRHTALIGSKDNPCDVDVVAVTNMPRSTTTAAYTHAVFLPFLERHYGGQFEASDRAWCITVDDEVTIDLVPTSEPDSPQLKEAIIRRALADWSPEDASPPSTVSAWSGEEALLVEAKRDREWQREEPLWIPDRTLKVWEKTHPLFLIGWTAKKNLDCNGKFVHVVKVIKWWRRHLQPVPKYPKGYPLEHIIGDCCPNGISSVAEGVTRTFEEIALRYGQYASTCMTPFLPARGVTDPEINVLRRVSGSDFAAFHEIVCGAASLARAAFDAKSVDDSAALWRKLLGSHFPKPPGQSTKVTGGFTPPSAPARPSEGRFA